MGVFLRRVTFVALGFLFANVSHAIDQEEVRKALKGDGATGYIHGTTPEAELFVFSFRNPENFFDKMEFPIVGKTAGVKADLAKLTRHDKVLIKGDFLDNAAPIRHIIADEVKVIKKFEPGVEAKPYEYQTSLPKDLEGKTEFIGNVHAVADGGKIIVVEYKDAIIPLPLRNATEVSKNLFRNDKVKIFFKIRNNPHSPVHIQLDPAVKEPIVVLEKIVDLHEKPATLEGNLVLFPKSPEIIFNVFAVLQKDADGFSRQFTMLNFDPEIFKGIREKLQKLWDEKPNTIVNGRNKFINTDVKIRIKGTYNVIDPGQGNPQVLLAGADAIELVK